MKRATRCTHVSVSVEVAASPEVAGTDAPLFVQAVFVGSRHSSLRAYRQRARRVGDTEAAASEPACFEHQVPPCSPRGATPPCDVHLVLQRLDGEEDLYTIGSAVLQLAPLMCGKPAPANAVRAITLPLDTGAGGPACELQLLIRVGDGAAAAGWLAPPQSPSATREAPQRAGSDLSTSSAGSSGGESPRSRRRFPWFRRSSPDSLLL